MPDKEDYEYLGWLMDHPEMWSKDDLSNARFIIANQKRSIAELHPKDVRGRRSQQEVVDRLEAAVQAHLR
jgi:hypothetical protein